MGQRGRPPAGLESDLAHLGRFFSPTSTGRRLREAVIGLPKIHTPRPFPLPDELYLASPNGRGLITPEGRVALHLLEKRPEGVPVTFDVHEVAWAYRIVADLYRIWGRDRILEALGIKENQLRLPVIAFNLFLLVNGSIGEDKSLPIPPEEELERELSGVIGPVIDAFVGSLRVQRRATESFRLRGGWILSETSRHLFNFVSFTTKAIWIHRNRTKPLLDRLARELARDKTRGRVDVEQAFEELAKAYSRARPALASRGIAHERSAETRAIRDQLLSSLELAHEVRLES